MPKTVILTVPDNAVIPDISLLTPSHTLLMLETMVNNIKELNNLSASLSQKEIYNKIKEETMIELQSLETNILVERKFSEKIKAEYEQREKKVFEEITDLKVQLKKAQSDFKVMNQEYIDAQVKIEREKFEAILLEKERQNQLTRETIEKTSKCLEGMMQRKSNTELSVIGESTLMTCAHLAFRDFDGFKLTDTHKTPHSGDCHLIFKEFTVLADSKQYSSSTVPIKDRIKIKEDLLFNEKIEFAWLVSMDSNIDVFNKAPFMFEFISDKKCICYINSLTKHKEPIELLRCVWFMCKLIHEKMMDKDETDDLSENDELNFLRKYQETVKENLLNYQKFSVNRDKTLKSLKNTLEEQDKLIRDILNKETNNFCDLVMQWWTNNIEIDEESTLKPIEMWNKFKKDNKEIPNDIGINNFKENLSICVNQEDNVEVILNPKGVITEIKNIRLKKNDTDIENIEKIKDKIKILKNETVLNIKTEKKKDTKKMNEKMDKIIDSITDNITDNKINEEEIIHYYVTENLNILDISNKINDVKPWKIISILIKNNIIQNRQDANGYDLYTETDEYKKKCIKKVYKE